MGIVGDRLSRSLSSMLAASWFEIRTAKVGICMGQIGSAPGIHQSVNIIVDSVAETRY